MPINPENRTDPFVKIMEQDTIEIEDAILDLIKMSIKIGITVTFVTIVLSIYNLTFVPMIPCITIQGYLLYALPKYLKREANLNDIRQIIYSDEYKVANVNLERVFLRIRDLCKVKGSIKAYRQYIITLNICSFIMSYIICIYSSIY